VCLGREFRSRREVVITFLFLKDEQYKMFCKKIKIIIWRMEVWGLRGRRSLIYLYLVNGVEDVGGKGKYVVYCALCKIWRGWGRLCVGRGGGSV
jgi:hypothetical protein